MHTDEYKKFDKRNVLRNLQTGLVTPKEYETYLLKLPDASEKICSAGHEDQTVEREIESKAGESLTGKKKQIKKR